MVRSIGSPDPRPVPPWDGALDPAVARLTVDWREASPEAFEGVSTRTPSGKARAWRRARRLLRRGGGGEGDDALIVGDYSYLEESRSE